MPFDSEPKRRRWHAAFLSGVLYGSWAGFKSADAGLPQQLLTGATQFVMSFAATFLLSTLLITLLVDRQSRLAAFIAAGAVASVYAAALIAVHLAVGTSHLASTVSPVICLAAAYAGWFSLTIVAANSARGSRAALPVDRGSSLE